MPTLVLVTLPDDATSAFGGKTMTAVMSNSAKPAGGMSHWSRPPALCSGAAHPSLLAKASRTSRGGVASASDRVLNRSSMRCLSRMFEGRFSGDARLQVVTRFG